MIFIKEEVKIMPTKNKMETKNLMTNRYNHSSINIKHHKNKKIKILKTEENKIDCNNNNKISKKKKGGLLYNFKNTISNAVKTIKNSFYKRNKKPIIQKQNIKNIKLKYQKKLNKHQSD